MDYNTDPTRCVEAHNDNAPNAPVTPAESQKHVLIKKSNNDLECTCERPDETGTEPITPYSTFLASKRTVAPTSGIEVSLEVSG